MGFILRLYLLICWTAVIFTLLTIPMPPHNVYETTYLDKLVHAVLFGVFAYLIVFTLTKIKNLNFKAILLISLVFSASYSLAGEYIQTFIPSRTASELDFLAGCAGIIIVLFFSYFKYGGR